MAFPIQYNHLPCVLLEWCVFTDIENCILSIFLYEPFCNEMCHEGFACSCQTMYEQKLSVMMFLPQQIALRLSQQVKTVHSYLL